MPRREATIGSRVGLHLQPAALFARAAAATGLPVTLARLDGPPVDGRNVLLVVGLGVRCGDRVVVEVADSAADPTVAEAALAGLVAFLETDHDA